jgi:hypothetical protein
MTRETRQYAIWKDGKYIEARYLTESEANELRNGGFDVYDVEGSDGC